MAWYNSDLGIGLGVGAAFAGIGLAIGLPIWASAQLRSAQNEKQPIIYEHVLGHEQPEVYVVQDGTPYFSHIDGKSIADFVRECYRPREQPPEVEPVSPDPNSQ